MMVEINNVNTEIRLTTSIIDKLKKNADKMEFWTEKRVSLGNANV